MDVRGQGALEYLLLIGGAVLVAAIVIALVTGIPTTVVNPEAVTFCASQYQFGLCENTTCDNPFVASDLSEWACEGKASTGLPAEGATDFVSCGVGSGGIRCNP